MADESSGKERTASGTKKAGRIRSTFRLKGRDPILAVCFTVIMLAFAAVIGVFINDHYISGTAGAPAGAGDYVTVNYTGSYYGYYDENGAQMFDTSVFADSENADYKKSFEFAPKTGSSDTPISFTIGGTDSYLQKFKDAVIGLNAGESAKVSIGPADGYGALTEDQIKSVGKSGNTMNVHETIKLDKFTELYGISKINGNMEVTSPYGWPADASPAGSQYVSIVHRPAAGSEYIMNGGVSMSVTAVSGTSITFDYIISFNYTSEEFAHPDQSVTGFKNVVLHKIVVENEERYITAAKEDGSEFITKNTDERTGMRLYFVITVVSITENANQTSF